MKKKTYIIIKDPRNPKELTAKEVRK